ncbi:putative T6SS immunity periplasmic lipoprotein [Gibbsiella quercinecans]|uniref:putative T6SS immunity periplasmic lipoprotein n=1 Tax=Gibbsiella quercinecans TaxID=929813 RepID=UPI002E77D082|nr:putative T6SS immunity periplasmic lipoprotein [Gibbsiella quercinecans]
MAGCSGSGDRLKADETTTVSKIGEDICFQVPDVGNYQPSLIAINPRGTPPQKLSVTDSPDLAVENGKLCIPPGFYQFPDKGQYIVQFILEALGDRRAQRSIVTGIALSGGHVESIPLTDSEITR